YQTVRRLEPDGDRASDCFQFVCEQLVKDKFRRLHAYDPTGPASFSTWLRAVVRNLCLDLRRKEFGRLRDFRSISRLTPVDKEVLGRALSRLTKPERLLVKLRFEDELTLEQIAGLLGLGNAQRADRQIKEVLARLRQDVDPTDDKNSGGKKSGASVKLLGKRT